MLKLTEKYRHNSRGMSLVELLLVMAIFSVVVLAVMSLYIPAVQSTAVQTQVSDMQGNLRLAMNRMTQDLLSAGFLVDPNFDSDDSGDLLPGPIYWEIFPYDDTVISEFTIRTRLTGRGFARAPDGGEAPGAGADVKLELSDPAMAEMFPVGSMVRLYEPISTLECDDPDSASATNTQAVEALRVYTVVANASGFLEIDDPNNRLSQGDVGNETVIVRVKDSSQPALQTIRYRVNNGALERIVNGTTQFLARNLDSATFGYEYSPNGSVKKIDVTLVGKTKKIKDGVLTGAKTRVLETSVTLRNVF